ncbi:MAG: Uma2 family endonuclease [Anaerolineae bacterium]|nr:Uma2 family endonuclease [Anaerolineae bacterium]
MSMIQKGSYTIQDFEAMIALPENEERLFELINGEIIEKVPTELHSIVAGNMYSMLRAFVKPEGLGRVLFEARHAVPGDENNARIPDVSFTRRERLLPVVEEGAIPLMPDLCIEVQSPDDSPRKLRDKAAYYPANGAQLVLIAYPKKRMIEAQYPDGEFDFFREDETIRFGDLLPGFVMRVKDVFDQS